MAVTLQFCTFSGPSISSNCNCNGYLYFFMSKKKKKKRLSRPNGNESYQVISTLYDNTYIYLVW